MLLTLSSKAPSLLVGVSEQVTPGSSNHDAVGREMRGIRPAASAVCQKPAAGVDPIYPAAPLSSWGPLNASRSVLRHSRLVSLFREGSLDRSAGFDHQIV